MCENATPTSIPKFNEILSLLSLCAPATTHQVQLAEDHLKLSCLLVHVIIIKTGIFFSLLAWSTFQASNYKLIQSGSIVHNTGTIMYALLECLWCSFGSRCVHCHSYSMTIPLNRPVVPIYTSIKKQLNKIEGLSRDGRAKKYTNKICGDNHIHYTSLRLLFLLHLLISTPIRRSGYFCFSLLVLESCGKNY